MNDKDITITIKASAKEFAAAMAAMQSQVKNASQSINDNLESTDQATSRTSDRFSSMGTYIQSALVAVALAASTAGLASITMAGNFEQSMNVLNSVTGASAEQMAQLSERARELGQDISLPGVSATDAASAMTELAKANLSVDQVLAASKGTLSLAKAGQVDVAFAAQTTAQALNAFGLAGEEASRVADLLAASANSSTSDVEGMALGLSQVGAGAKSMGVNIQDTITALAMFSNAGINGSDAGTSLKTMFQMLASPTKESAKAMSELGLDFFDAQGNFVGLADTAEQLQNKLGSLTVEQKNAALATIFGSDSSRVAGILAAQGAEGFDQMSAAVNKSGAAQELAAAQNSGFNGALDNLISTIETVGTDLGIKVLPPLTEFLKLMAEQLPPAVNWAIDNGQTLAIAAASIGSAFATIRIAGTISDFAKAKKTLDLFVGEKNAVGIKAIGSAFMHVANGAKSAVIWIGKGTIEIASHGAAVAVSTAKLAVHAVAQGAVRTATAAWTAAQWLLNAALNANPLTLIMVGVMALVAGLALLYANCEGFRNAVNAAFSMALGAIQAVWNWASQNWPLLLAILTGPIGLAVLAIIQNWETVKTAFAAALQFVQGIWGGVVAWFGSVWNGIVSVFSSVADWFGNIFTNAWNAVMNVFANIGEFFGSVWNTIVSIFSSVGTAIGDAIGGSVRGVVNSILGFAEDTINGFIGAINIAVDTINDIPGVTIGRLSYLDIPRLASGGIANATSGGQLVTVAEGGQDEWIIPESKMASVVQQLTSSASKNTSGNTITQNFTVNVTVENDGTDFTQEQAESMGRTIAMVLRAQGLGVNEMGALR